MALNLHLLCRLIAMFLTNSMSSAPTAAPREPAAKKSKSQDLSRHIDNLDYRCCQLEEDRGKFSLSAERSTGAVAKLRAAEGHYKSRAPQRGPASPGPQQKSNPHGSSAQLDSDARPCFAQRGSKGGGGSPRQCPCSTTHTKRDGTAERTQGNPALLHEPATDGRRWGHAPSSQPNAIPANLSFHSVYCRTLH